MDERDQQAPIDDIEARVGSAQSFLKVNPERMAKLTMTMTPSSCRLASFMLREMSLKTNQVDLTYDELADTLKGMSKTALTRAMHDLQATHGRNEPFLARIGHARYMVNPAYACAGRIDSFLAKRLRFREAAASKGIEIHVTGAATGAATDFTKVARHAVFGVMPALGRGARVMMLLMREADAFNHVRMSQREMMAKAEVSAPTIVNTMRILRGDDHNWRDLPGLVLENDHFLVMVKEGHYLINPVWAHRGTLRRFDLIREQYVETLVANHQARAGFELRLP